MKRSLSLWFTLFSCLLTGFNLDGAEAQPPPPVFTGPTPQAAPAPASPAATPAPPPSAPPLRSAADLEKLVAPIALYPDPLIATVLMASVYPLEVVQAARFVANTNNLANLDAQPWDENVKALARVPDAVRKLNDDLPWTIELGEAFLAQDKAIMDAIQSMRSKAQKAGTLQTNPQQTVIVTNMIVEKTVEQQVVVVTNTVVQIQPSNPSVVYVPTYNPTTVYYPPPYYVYDPIAPLVTFTAGVAMGAIIANNCNWHGGGCYHGGDIDIDINNNRNVNRNTNIDRSSTRPSGSGQKWQPDQNRLKSSGAPGASAAARSADARGWSGGAGSPTAGTRPSTGAAGARPSTGAVGARPSGGTPSARPTPGTTPSANRPTPSPSQGANRPTPSASQGANRPSPSASQSASRPSPSSGASQNRSAPSGRASSGSAFSGASGGGNARASSSRGSASRGGGGGGGRGGGGGGRR